ncbi:hypothetical protein ACFLTA_09005 [Bacteroidota bacterium]
MNRYIHTWIIALVIFISGGCEKDSLENYRKDFTGNFEFTTIREDLTSVAPSILDTLYYTGSIEAIYSNRKDLIKINFSSENSIDALVNTSGSLSLPPVLNTGRVKTITGIFTDGNSRVRFDYKVSSGSSYSVNHRVEGIRP